MGTTDVHVLARLNEWVIAHGRAGAAVIGYVEVAQFAIAAIVIALYLGGRSSTRRAALTAGCAAGVAVLVAQVITAVFDRARPFVAHPALVHALVHHGPDRSFPSDSATGAFAITAVLLAYAPRWGRLVLVLALGLCVGRVAVGMHYPTDVAAGALLGVGVARILRTSNARRAFAALDQMLWFIPAASRTGRFARR